jgi:hypothetical protein
MMRVVDWLKHHEYIAALIGAIATVLTLASRFTKPPSTVTRNRVSVIVLFFTFALEATIALSPTAGVIARI